MNNLSSPQNQARVKAIAEKKETFMQTVTFVEIDSLLMEDWYANMAESKEADLIDNSPTLATFTSQYTHQVSYTMLTKAFHSQDLVTKSQGKCAC